MLKIDKNSNGVIDYQEFVEAFGNLPGFSMQSVMSQAYSSIEFDTGNELGLPNTKMENKGNPWVEFIASSFAISVSRTLLAPFERIKILQ